MTECYASPKCNMQSSQAFEINWRPVLGIVENGGGRSTLEKLCACLNLPSPLAKETYNGTLKVLKGIMEVEATISMNKAAELEHSNQSCDRSNIIECKAMFDGTWRK